MTRLLSFSAVLLFAAVFMADDASAQADPRIRKPPPEAANLEGGDDFAPPPMEPEEIPELKPRDDITSIKPLPPELPDRTRELLGDTNIILDIPLNQIPNYRDEMRMIVEELTTYARTRMPGYTVVTFGGFDLLSWGQREYDLAELKRPEMAKPSMVADAELPVGFPMHRYRQRVNGFILDGFFCAPIRVPQADVELMRSQSLKALSADHCPPERAENAFEQARKVGIVAHVDTDMDRKFAAIPKVKPNPENSASVENLNAAKSMLINLDNRGFGTKVNWMQALKNTNHDVLVVPAFFNGNQPLTKAEIHTLKFKKLGARRLVLGWIDVGQASDDAYYWQRDWKVGEPSWITALDHTKPGKYHIEFWNPAWKAIIGKMFAGLVDLGFDGIVIANVEAYQRWELMTPVN